MDHKPTTEILSNVLTAQRSQYNSSPTETSSKDTLIYTIQGIVIDSVIRERVPFAIVTVSMEDKTYQTVSDTNGVFKINIPDDLIFSNLVLNISYIGYKTHEEIIPYKDLPANKEFLLSVEEFNIMGELLIETQPKKHWWQIRKKCKQ
jgi:hypothetical protein